MVAFTEKIHLRDWQSETIEAFGELRRWTTAAGMVRGIPVYTQRDVRPVSLSTSAH